MSHRHPLDEYAKFVVDYTLEKAAKVSGVPLNRLGALAESMPIRRPRSSALDHGIQPAYPRRLVQQSRLQHPSSDRKDFRARQQPVLAHRPALGLWHCARGRHLLASVARRHGRGEQGSSRQDRAIWKVPEGTIPDKPGYHAVLQSRMLRDGLLNAYWVQVNNNLQAGPNINEESYPGFRNPDNFIVVSDAYPTVTALAADLMLPTAMWVEKEGAYGNAERRTHFWHQLVSPGRSRSDLWQLLEFSKRFKIEEVWPDELLAKKPEYRGKTLFDVLYRNGEVDKFPLRTSAGLRQRRIQGVRLLCAEGTVRGIRHVRPRPRS